MIKDPNNFDILTDDNEKNSRLELCNTCEKNTSTNQGPICDACACPIDYVITYKFKICPLNKWSVE